MIHIIMPAYNEEMRIRNTLKDYTKNLPRLCPEPVRLIVVSDSTDRTDEIVSAFAGRYKWVSLMPGSKRTGKGASIMRGMDLAIAESARNDIVGFIDADDSVSAAELAKMIAHLRRAHINGVIASRYLKGSKVVGSISIRRIVASRAYNALVRTLFGLDYTDTQCGAKLFRSEALSKVAPHLSLKGLSFDVNLLFEFKLRGVRIEEIPVRYSNSERYTKTGVLMQSPRMLASTLGYWLKAVALRNLTGGHTNT